MARRASIASPERTPLRRPWLDPTQRRLLQAGMAHGDAAVEAWREFQASSIRLADLDPASQRLLPLVYRNLAALEPYAAGLAPLKTRYQETWYRNQILRHQGARALSALSGAGIETIVLKGAALSSLYYRDSGVRPMDDFDVLIRPEATARALGALRGDGWIPDEADPIDVMLRHHGTALSRRGGGRLDLHWNLLWQAPGDAEAWSASQPVEIAGAATRRLDPADQLLHVCVHGSSSSELAPIRWVTDTLMILDREGASFPWARLIEQASRRELTVTMHSMLAYLGGTLGASVPAAVLESLEARRASRTERLAHLARVTPQVRGRKLAMVWERYRKLALEQSGSTGPAGLASFLQSLWRLEHRRQLPAELLRRTFRHGFSRDH